MLGPRSNEVIPRSLATSPTEWFRNFVVLCDVGVAFWGESYYDFLRSCNPVRDFE